MEDTTTRQRRMEMRARVGRRTRIQMECANEMGLSAEDVRRLALREPQRYGKLAVALGVRNEGGVS